jgi:hypothetical protein
MTKRFPFSSLPAEERARIAKNSLVRNEAADRIAAPLFAQQIAQLADDDEGENVDTQPYRLAAGDDDAAKVPPEAPELPTFTVPPVWPAQVDLDGVRLHFERGVDGMGRAAFLVRAEFTDPNRAGVYLHFVRRVIRLIRPYPQDVLGTVRDFFLRENDPHSAPAALTLAYELK